MMGKTLFVVGWWTDGLVLDGVLLPADLIDSFFKQYGFAYTVSMN